MAALPEDVQGQVDLVRRESLFNLGVALMSRRRPHEAIPHLDRLVAGRPNEQRYALCLATCLLAVGRFRDAVVCADGFLMQDGASVDMQLLRASALSLAGDAHAAEAIELYVYRIVCEIGSLAAAMGGLDALVFTGGVGENAAPIRERVAAGCAWLGELIDTTANRADLDLIHASTSRVAMAVIPTDEESVIATQTLQLLAAMNGLSAG
jgi:tetratricopeptide (TPR) repeat protein